MGFKRKIKKIVSPVLIKFAKFYLSKEREYTYNDIKVKVSPGVFHPGLFISTKILLEYLSGHKLIKKSLLELGAGSGLISIFASKKGAVVTASDINSTAINNIKRNAHLNNSEINIIQSDLFNKIKPQTFDWIVINPPYFPRDPKEIAEYAWFCGQDFEYFRKLFQQIKSYASAGSNVVMILSEDCEIELISEIASLSGIELRNEFSKRVWGEWNYIYRLTFPQ